MEGLRCVGTVGGSRATRFLYRLISTDQSADRSRHGRRRRRERREKCRNRIAYCAGQHAKRHGDAFATIPCSVYKKSLFASGGFPVHSTGKPLLTLGYDWRKLADPGTGTSNSCRREFAPSTPSAPAAPVSPRLAALRRPSRPGAFTQRALLGLVLVEHRLGGGLALGAELGAVVAAPLEGGGARPVRAC